MFRRYKLSDCEIIHAMLTPAGFMEADVELDELRTKLWIEDNMIIGLFTWRYEYFIPYLVHFYITPKFRNFMNMRKLLKVFLSDIVSEGNRKEFIAGIISENKRLVRLVERYFKTQAYAESGGMNFYCVEAK